MADTGHLGSSHDKLCKAALLLLAAVKEGYLGWQQVAMVRLFQMDKHK